MTIWWLAVILLAIISAGIGFIWLATRVGGGKPNKNGGPDSFQDAAELEVEHIFSEEFREELRNRGRLHFEKIIGENAMFLQQDLRLTTSELNQFMKNEITNKLKEEFDKYEQSITDAKELAVQSIEKTNKVIDETRESLSEEVRGEILKEKQQSIERFEANMADIINHYVLEAIGTQIDLNDQLEYILGDLEANKKAIIEDVKSGA